MSGSGTRGTRLARVFARSILAWTAAFAIYLLILVLGPKAPPPESWATRPLTAVVMLAVLGSIWGVIHGWVSLLADHPAIRHRSYAVIIAIQVAAMLVATGLTVFASSLGNVAIGVADAGDWIDLALGFLRSARVVPLLAYVAVVTLVLSFARQVSVMVGRRILGNVMRGYYRQPRTEDRVFLFLDLQDSTTHAERLGPERYCRLIQDCFRDLTEAAVRRSAEVYQYVGDEAVLTWVPEDAARDANCVRVVYDFDDTLRRRGTHYQTAYGVVPRFKGGLNGGTVMAAEVGIVKRDILYLSEVLHVASRIQSQCNRLGKQLLVSRTVRDMLPECPDLRIEALGDVELRGHHASVEIFGVEPTRS